MKKYLLYLLILLLTPLFSACSVDLTKVGLGVYDLSQIKMPKLKVEEIKIPDFNDDLLYQVQKRQKLVVGVKFDTKPFGYRDEKTKELMGFDIDLGRKIAQSILGDENKVVFKQVNPTNRIQMLNSNQVDMLIATMTMTNLRSEVVKFSYPYHIAGQSVLVKTNSDVKSMSDLNNKKAGVIYGTTAEKNLVRIAPEVIIVGYKNYANALKGLLSGEVDAITSDDTILLGIAIDNKATTKLLPKRYSEEPYAIAFRKDGKSDKLLARTNFVIDFIKKNGELAQLRAKWIKTE